VTDNDPKESALPRPFPRAVTLLGAFLAALTALTGPALAVNSGQPAGSASQSPASRLLLINGAWVAAAAGHGAPPVIFPAGRGLAGTIETVRLGARTLAIPLAALPFLGHGLRPSLFDLSALAHSERDGRLPLTLTFLTRLHAPPGVTVTRTGPGTAQGYLTSAGARKLGAALARQFAADHDAGSYGTDGLFAGGLSLALAGAPSAPVPVHPDFPMHTLTLTATALNGRPDTGDEVFVFNVDKPDALGLFASNFFYHGSVKFSVPSGTYWAAGVFSPVSGKVLETRTDVLPQFTVHGSTSVHLSERAATAKIGFAVPRPANLQLQALTISRTARGAGDSTAIIGLQTGGTMWVSPVTRAPGHGVLTADTAAWLTSPGHPAVPYTYSLNRVDPAGLILRDQHYAVSPGDLATVQQNYDQDVRTTGGPSCSAPAAVFLISVCVSEGVRRPGSEVQYLTASPASGWMTSYSEYAGLIGGQAGGFQLLHAGEQLTQEWNRYPLHPAPNVSPPGVREISSVPSAVRAGNTLSLQITPFSDSTYGHTGTGFSTDGFVSYKLSGRYAIYSDGVRIAGGDAVKAAGGLADLGVRARLSSRPSVIKLVLTASRASRRFLLSAVSRDVWTWPSRPEPKATLTGPWTCSASLTGVSRHCAVQGMLALRYFVAGISPTGTTAAGRQRIGLAVDHLQEFRSSRITSVGAQVSFNGGQTWRQATVQRNGPARFSLSFTGSPSLVTLRVSARDAAGDTITETLPGAYRIASATSLPPAFPPAFSTAFSTTFSTTRSATP
jgi:hypothetical protein